MASTLAGSLPYKGVVALLDECADRSGEWVLKADIEVSEGISPIQLRNELVALSKLTNRLFGRGTWPIATKKELGSFHYRMDPGLAKWWREARAQSEGAMMTVREVCPFHADDDVAGVRVSDEVGWAFTCDRRGHPRPGPYSWLRPPEAPDLGEMNGIAADMGLDVSLPATLREYRGTWVEYGVLRARLCDGEPRGLAFPGGPI